MERVAGGFFKSIFGIIIAICGILVLVSWAAMDSVGGSMSPGILIPLAIIAWILLRRRKAKEVEPAQAQSRPLPAINMGDRLEGVGAMIEVRSAGLAITRQGASSFFIHGLKGEKLLPFKSITAVQVREPTRKMSGYIQFSLLGGIESNRGIWDASKDENTVLFAHEQLTRFLALRNLVEERLSGPQNSESRSTRTQDLATLAALRADGHLSEEEFAAEKAKLLAS